MGIKKNNTMDVTVYVALMTAAFTTQLSGRTVPILVSEIISLVILVYTLTRYLFNRKKESEKKGKTTKRLIALYFIPAFLIHLYSIIMTSLGIMDSRYMNANLSAYAPIIASISAVALFKKNAIKYTFISIIFAWIISFSVAILMNGPSIIPYAINQAYFGDTTEINGIHKNYLEFHDIVLSLGLVAIYYIFSKKKLTKNDIPLIILFLVITGLGMKRIAILGIILALTFIFISRKVTDKKVNLLRVGVGLSIFTVSIIFLGMIFNGTLYEHTGNVNLMGRNYYYDVIKEYGSFDPSFVGTGRNSVSMILTYNHSYLHVGGVHSDILKMYIENGFVVFIIWLLYYLFILPRIIGKKYDQKTLRLYLAMIIYTFILYFTDNVENYFIYQTLFVMIPCCYYLESQTKKELKENGQ